jgi:hypothetical protein
MLLGWKLVFPPTIGSHRDPTVKLWYASVLRWALAKAQKNALLFRKNATDAARSRKQTQKNDDRWSNRDSMS